LGTDLKLWKGCTQALLLYIYILLLLLLLFYLLLLLFISFLFFNEKASREGERAMSPLSSNVLSYGGN
jgi:hypothetical protein